MLDEGSERWNNVGRSNGTLRFDGTPNVVTQGDFNVNRINSNAFGYTISRFRPMWDFPTTPIKFLLKDWTILPKITNCTSETSK